MLNYKQQFALDCINQGKNVFITGGGGTGKSFIIKQFIDKCRSNNINIMVTATTGIAAINIDGATLHRTFKLPIRPLIDEPKFIPSELKDTDILIIEEVSMMRLDTFDYVAKSLIVLNKYRRRKGMKDIQIILVGDFLQLPPVITDKDREFLEEYKYGDKLGSGFAFQSEYWEALGLIHIELDEVVRQSDKKFIDNLHKIRFGDKSGIKFFNKNASAFEIKDAILICGTNKAVEQKNSYEFEKLDSKKEKVYKAEIDGTVAESDKVAPEVLELKVGCRVMTLTNDTEDKYKNGTLATVVELTNKVVTIETDDGGIVKIEKYTWAVNEYTSKNGKVEIKEIGHYRQFPLRLAYAATIHKSQGKTFSKVNINPYCWSEGQLYVALSRVETMEGMCLTSPIQDRFLVTSNEVVNFYNSFK